VDAERVASARRRSTGALAIMSAIAVAVAANPRTVRELIATVTAGVHLGGVPAYRPTETRQWIELLGEVITGER
jgi:hypothetical protein